MKGPVTAYLYVTLKCNARCGFCTIWRDRGGQTIDRELGLKLIDEMTELPIRHVDFTGGEPLLCRHLPELLRRAKGHGFFTTLTTNGISYQSVAEELHGSVDLLSFSLNGPNAEVHDASQGVKCFDSVVSGIEKARRLGENIRVQFTVTEESVEHLPDTAALARSLGVSLQVVPVISYFGNTGISQETLAGISRMKIPGVRLNPAAVLFYSRGGNDIRKPVCTAGRSAIAISPTGDLFLPCFHQSKATVSAVGGLKEAYHSLAAERLMNLAGRMPCCRGCTNWCYINPSFLLKPSLYHLLYIKFALGNAAHIYGLRGNRLSQAWRWLVQHRCPRTVEGSGIDD